MKKDQLEKKTGRFHLNKMEEKIMDICSVHFVYKCQTCGGLAFQGPYYFTSDSNIFDHLQYAINEMIEYNRKNIFEFTDREGYYLHSSMVSKISFHKLMQYKDNPDEILKYSWHDCDTGSNNSIYENVSGIALLSGFKFEYINPDNPTNNGFVRRLVELSKGCEKKEDLFKKLTELNNQRNLEIV